ncbi:MAG: thermonuclease family protein [Candidatus Omnitrophica bacterium]|nr:thermonuclease family protein [Candidatus Omnitrophota bacterium]
MRVAGPVLIGLSVFLGLVSGCANNGQGASPVTRVVGPNSIATTKFRLGNADIIRLSNGTAVKMGGIIFAGDSDRFNGERYGVSRQKLSRLDNEARDAIANILNLSQEIRVEFIPGAHDSQGRRYAYIFARTFDIKTPTIMEKEIFKPQGAGYDVFLNAYLVRLGYACVDAASDTRYRELLRKMENRARLAKAGIW